MLNRFPRDYKSYERKAAGAETSEVKGSIGKGEWPSDECGGVHGLVQAGVVGGDLGGAGEVDAA